VQEVGSAGHDPEVTREAIMTAAFAEFSRYGLAGARIDRIADQTKTSKRMIYYYFGSKAGLYQEILVEAYRRVGEVEIGPGIPSADPLADLRSAIRAILEHYEGNIRFIRLVLLENSFELGAVERISADVCQMNQEPLTVINDVLSRGRALGIFREGPQALDVYQLLMSMAFFRVSDRFSWIELFGRDMVGKADSQHIREFIEDAVVRYVLADVGKTPDN
jgi:AcrR family transcriptional regulator